MTLKRRIFYAALGAFLCGVAIAWPPAMIIGPSPTAVSSDTDNTFTGQNGFIPTIGITQQTDANIRWLSLTPYNYTTANTDPNEPAMRRFNLTLNQGGSQSGSLARKNQVMTLGYNNSSGDIPESLTDASFVDRWETYWNPSTTNVWMERHVGAVGLRDGTGFIRPISIEIEWNANGDKRRDETPTTQVELQCDTLSINSANTSGGGTQRVYVDSTGMNFKVPASMLSADGNTQYWKWTTNALYMVDATAAIKDFTTNGNILLNDANGNITLGVAGKTVAGPGTWSIGGTPALTASGNISSAYGERDFLAATIGNISAGALGYIEYSGATSASTFLRGVEGTAVTDPAVTANLSASTLGGGLVGGRFEAFSQGLGTLTRGSAISALFKTGTNAGTVTAGHGLLVEAPVVASGNTITSYYGMRILQAAPTGTITTGYGLGISAMSSGTTKYQVALDSTGAGNGIYFNTPTAAGVDYIRDASASNIVVNGATTAALTVGGSTILSASSTGVAVTGTLSATGNISGEQIAIVVPLTLATQAVNQWSFIADRAYTVQSIKENHVTASTSGTLQVGKVLAARTTDAVGDVANGNKAFMSGTINLASTANTPTTGTLSGTGSDYVLAAGDKIGLSFTGTIGTYVGGCVTIILKSN